MIRITQSMQVARTLLDQNRNLQRMNDYSNDMSSNYNLHRPSDDPIRVARAMRLQTELRVNETYKANLQASESWTSKTDVTLTTLDDIIKRVRELTVQASSEDKVTEDKQKIRSEIEQLKKSAIQIANDDYMGRYQFSGYKTNEKFANDDGTYNTNLNLAGLKYEKINYNIGVGQKTEINFTGVEVFGNEYFTTKTRAFSSVPFTDEPESLLGATLSIKLQKYEQPEKYYTIDTTNTNTQAGASSENENNDAVEEKYEKTRELTSKIGNEIVLDGISFYGSYKKDDLNAIVEDLNISLRMKIDKYVKDNSLTDDDKEELYQAVQFVNDDGKISLVTDRDYSGKIEPLKLNLKQLQVDATSSIPVTLSLNHEISTVSQLDYTNPDSVKTYFNFDLVLDEYNKDDNGNVDTALGIKKTSVLSGISLTKEYSKDGRSDFDIANLIASDLKTQINRQLMQNNIDPDKVRVIVDGNNQPQIIVDREYGAKVNNVTTSGGMGEISSNLTNKTYQPNRDPAQNTNNVMDLDIDLSGVILGENTLVNLNFNLELTKYSRYGSAGDVLVAQPGVSPTAGVVPAGEEGYLVVPATADYPQTVFNLDNISVTKTYSAKNSDGSNKTADKLLREIATDIKMRINEKAASAGIDPNMIRVEAKDGKINLVIDGNLKSELTNIATALVQNTFSENAVLPKVDEKSTIDIPLPTPIANEDLHVYMNIDMGIEKFAADIKGNTDTSTTQKPKIDIEGISINKTYPRTYIDNLGNYQSYTDAQLQEQVFDDIKSAIEEKLSQLNPPLDKKAINIEQLGNNMRITVNQDIKLEVKNNEALPSSLESKVDYLPEDLSTDYKNPTREMMPFFEMMDRLMQFMDEGNSKGLSRMLDVVDYHAKNNQKNQGIGGGRSNMYKIMLQRTEDIKLNYTQLRSDTIETDYNETSMKMMVAQYVYRASLAVTAKLIQPSLVDFLR